MKVSLEESDDEKMMTDLMVTIYGAWENPNSQIGSIDQVHSDGITSETSILDHTAQEHLHLL